MDDPINTYARTPTDTVKKIELCMKVAREKRMTLEKLEMGFFEVRDLVDLRLVAHDDTIHQRWRTEFEWMQVRPIRYKDVPISVRALEDGITMICIGDNV